MLFCSIIGNAQTTTTTSITTTTIPAKSKGYNKGHFIFGTNLLNYSAGTSTENDYSSGSVKDTFTTKISNFSFSFNIWGGYFLSDRVCVGLNFNNSSNSIYGGYPYYYNNGPYYGALSPFIPSNLFFRYYIAGQDSGLVGFFLEGIVGGSYSSGTYTFGPRSSVYNNSGSVPVNQTSFNASINAVLALNVSNHFAFLFKAGLLYNTLVVEQAAYSYIDNNNMTTTVPESKSIVSEPSFIGTIGLQYKL